MKKLHIALGVLVMILSCIILGILYFYNIIPHRNYTASDFQIATIKSDIDADLDGIDDYTDIMLGAKAEIQRDPIYRSVYYQGGYPPAEEGVCTDVIWRSLKDAGYDLKKLMDDDIKENQSAYSNIQNIDPNIDFRRVPNIKVFLDRHAISLTLQLDAIEEWQPGDIVVFSNSHIGILSDIRNHRGLPFLLHNGNLPVQEEDALEREDFLKGISGHYRFNLRK